MSLQHAIVLNHINVYRALHNVPGLQWSSECERYAQWWANYLANTSSFLHSPSRKYGENIAMMRTRQQTNTTDYMKRAVDLWMSEYPLYNFSRPGYNETTGHFTSIVWKGTQYTALGVSVKNNKVYIVMSLYPHGNIIGGFKYNVFDRKVDKHVIVLPPPPPPVYGTYKSLMIS